VTRHVLADCLKKLVCHGVLRRVPYQTRPERYEDVLTQKGLDLYPIVMAIVYWATSTWSMSAGGSTNTSSAAKYSIR